VISSDSAPSQSIPDLTLGEFETLLGAEVAGLSDDVLPTYERYRVSPIRMAHRWDDDGGQVGAPVWVVARDGSVVLGYDEVEEEWGIGCVSGAGRRRGRGGLGHVRRPAPLDAVALPGSGGLRPSNGWLTNRCS
jgi:hypothetical protein